EKSAVYDFRSSCSPDSPRDSSQAGTPGFASIAVASGKDSAMQASTSAAARTFLSGFRRWFRCCCFARLPLSWRFFTPAKPQPAPKPGRKSQSLDVEVLGSKWLPNDTYGVVQTALLGEVVHYLATTFRSPAQVLFHGW